MGEGLPGGKHGVCQSTEFESAETASGASFLLCFQFGFHAKDNEESLSDSESGNDVMGLLLLLQLDWRLFKLDAGK